MAALDAGAVAPKPAAADVPAADTKPAPQPQIVDFVCEADVRAAMKESRKIYIGPKTIVTPAARDVTGSSGILVMAQR
jgi:hypothetical protein